MSTLKADARSTPGRFWLLIGLTTSLLAVSGPLATASPSRSENARKRILAQKVMEELVGKHSEVQGMEVSATPPGQAACVTIASTEARDLGEKCDDDEFTAIKTNRPFVEKEIEGGKEVFDVTMPLHDKSGKVIGTVGLDFKPTPGQEQALVVEQATQIAREFEGRIPSSAKLFEPAE